MGDESRLIVTDVEEEQRPCQLSRRRFLQAAGVGATTVAALSVPGYGELMAKTTSLPRQSVAKLSDLKVDKPVYISYPDKKSRCILVKLGVPAGGGVGPDKDIVAFGASCPHM